MPTTGQPTPTNSPHYVEFRKDGWPLCPQCGEDELYALDIFWSDEKMRPSLAECLAGKMRCYNCNWISWKEPMTPKLTAATIDDEVQDADVYADVRQFFFTRQGLALTQWWVELPDDDKAKWHDVVQGILAKVRYAYTKAMPLEQARDNKAAAAYRAFNLATGTDGVPWDSLSRGYRLAWYNVVAAVEDVPWRDRLSDTTSRLLTAITKPGSDFPSCSTQQLAAAFTELIKLLDDQAVQLFLVKHS